jgi:hypothetical protein
MAVDMTCSVCGGNADAMAVHHGKVICFACLANKYPEVAATLVRYLTEVKGVKLT